ncbi:FdhD protein [Desulfitispora alkaliphila]|uniref:formate dehydrogenase accessory sulfurtransferase FdhD n=1 Tax=Desulfitispora alkaliphila TaxID=622674 RepID=UPI003D19813C
MTELTQGVTVWRRSIEEAKEMEDLLAKESPLTIYFNDKEIVTLLCTPEHMDELAVGFLAAEGIINTKEDLKDVHLDEDKGAAWIEGKEQPFAEKMFLKRYITTGCGKGTTFYNVLDVQTKPIESNFSISIDQMLKLMKSSQTMSELFKETGGVHGNALCNTDSVLLFRDDIGRHNATDKIVGKCFMEDIGLDDKMLLTSGRISSEILLKVAKVGIPVIASRSAPTALAVNLAEKLGVTIVGFARASRCNVYTSPQRIK